MNILYLFYGYVKYRVVSDNREKLINLLKEKTSIRDIKICKNDELWFCVFPKQQMTCEDILKNQNASIVSRKKRGLYFLIKRYKKRIGLLTGILLSALLLYISSCFVWDIQVSGNESVDDEIIIRVLNDCGFREGLYKKSIDIKSIVNRFLIAEDSISSIAINLEGTVAHIEVREAKITPLADKSKDVNLVAGHNGIIFRVDAVRGQPAVVKDDVVTRGQMLVSAFVDKRTGGNLLQGAAGFVWAKTSRQFHIEVPLVYYEKEKSDKTHTGYSFDFLGIQLDFSHFSDIKSKCVDKAIIRQNLVVSDDIVLPIKMTKTQIVPYGKSRRERTEKKALDIAKGIADRCLVRSAKNFTKTNTYETYAVENDRLIYDVTFEGVEDIAKELKFDMS